MSLASAAIHDHFLAGFQTMIGDTDPDRPRIGAELKFPFVNADGSAVSRQALFDLWTFLSNQGWAPERDTLTGSIVGVRKPGERNDSIASYETGYVKPEFALAHVDNLLDLEASVEELLGELRAFQREKPVHFLGYGIHPVTPPGKDLLMKKVRSSFWDTAFPSNEVIPPDQGDDVHLFTVNTASHVHVGVPPEKAVKAVNVLNGFAGAQIALTANSGVWRNAVDPRYRCVSEKLWDWWRPAVGRVGVPPRPFQDLEDYVDCVTNMTPVYVKRNGYPLILQGYSSFAEYFENAEGTACNLEGKTVPVRPAPEDVELHNSCYWFNARISRYYTVENRACDQQPVDSLLCPAALTLGLVTACDEAWEELQVYDWKGLRMTREVACREGLIDTMTGALLRILCRSMLGIAEHGLRNRGLGEERFLMPLKERLESKECPSRSAEKLYGEEGIQALVDARSI